MKRPLVLLGFSYLIAAAVFCYFPIASLIGIAILMLFLAVAVFCLERFVFKSGHFHLTLLCCAIAAVSMYGIQIIQSDPLVGLENATAELQGYVESVEAKGYVLVCDSEDIDSSYSSPLRVYIRTSDSRGIVEGDTLRFTAELHHVDLIEDNSIRITAKANGCFLMARQSGELLEINREITMPNALQQWIWKMRHALNRSAEQLFDHQRGFFQAILYGENRNLDPNLKTNFQTTGLSHVLALSGMHLSIIVGLIFRVFRKLSGRRIAAAISMASVLLFMALTGFSPSITRAGIMSLILYLGMIIWRKADPLNSLGAAALLITVCNPFSAADLSLQLSVVSTLGIICMAEPIETAIHNFFCSKWKWMEHLQNIYGVLSVTLAANIALLPYSALVFESLSLVSPIANLLATPLIPVIISCGMISCVLSMIPGIGFLGELVALPAQIVAAILGKAAELLSKIPFASVPLNYPFIVIWLLTTAGMITYTLYRGRNHLKYVVVLSLMVLFSSVICYNGIMRNHTSVLVQPADEQPCVVVAEPNGTIAICSVVGQEAQYVLLQQMRQIGREKIDVLIIPEYDDSAYLADLAQEFKVSTLIVEDAKSDASVIAALQKSCNRYCSFSDYDLAVNTDLELLLRQQENGSVVYIDSDPIKLTLTFGDVNVMDVFDEVYDTDFLIFSSQLPAGVDYLNLSHLVFTNSKYYDQLYRRCYYLAPRISLAEDLIVFDLSENRYQCSCHSQ